MHQKELHQQLAAAKGDDVATIIARLGLGPLTTFPHEIEERAEPLVFDWDLYAGR